MNWKDRYWRYATAIVVVLALLNPETVHVALFIDAVGLDIFLMAVEVQILAALGIVLFYYIKPIKAYLKSFSLHNAQVFSMANFRELARTLVLVIPCEATIMHMLVFFFTMSIVFNVQQ